MVQVSRDFCDFLLIVLVFVGTQGAPKCYFLGPGGYLERLWGPGGHFKGHLDIKNAKRGNPKRVLSSETIFQKSRA